MDGIRYEPDHKGTGELLVTKDMHDVVAKAADAGKDYAVTISPDREPYAVGYISSFTTTKGLVETVARSPRATAHLINEAPYAAAVEWQYEHHVLARTADYLTKSWFPNG